MITMARTPSGSSIEVVEGSPAEIERLRAEFERQHCVKLPRLLGEELFEEVVERVAQAEFAPLLHKDFQSDASGSEDAGFVEASMKQESPAFALLLFLMNDPHLFELVQRVTGCDPIGRFDGRVYRMDPSAYSGWHDDIGDDRMVAMSLNLSSEPYAGGVLQLRERRSRQILRDAPNTGPGDAILFRVADHLQHQITPVEGRVSKLAFAGWFKSSPGLFTTRSLRHREPIGQSDE
jgi:hypothetical protein